MFHRYQIYSLFELMYIFKIFTKIHNKNIQYFYDILLNLTSTIKRFLFGTAINIGKKLKKKIYYVKNKIIGNYK